MAFSGAGVKTLSASASTAADTTVGAGVTFAVNGAGVTFTQGNSNNQDLTVNGTLVVSGGATLTSGASGSQDLIINSGSLFRILSGDFPTGFDGLTIHAASTVEYGAAGVEMVASQTYGNLVLSGSGTKTGGAAVVVAGDFTNNSGVTFAGGTATTFNDGFTNNGTFAVGTTTTFNGGFTNNGTFAPGANTVTFSGTGQQIAGVTNPTKFNNLTINPGAGDVVTLGQNITVAGNLTVSSGTLDLGAFTANPATSGGTLTVASGATLKIGGASNFPINYTTNTLTGTVEYNGATQTIVLGVTYGNLVVSGAGSTKIPAANLTIAGNLTVASGTLDLNGFTANRSAVGGVLTVAAVRRYASAPPQRCRPTTRPTR